MRVTHLSLFLLGLPTRSSLEAAHGVSTASARFLTVVGLHLNNELGTVAGWGECSALNAAGYTPEWAEGAFDLLRSGAEFDRTTAPMAAASVEMAVLDAELKQAGQSLADRLGTTGLSATAGGVVGLAPLPTMLDEVEDLVDQGYRRVKIKIAPGRIVTPIRAIRSSFPEVELQVDANASLRSDDLAALLQLRDLGVRAIEQPFPIDDHQSASRLVAESDMAIVADEAVVTAADIDALASDRAATAIAVKPGRLGGLQNTLDLLDRVHVAGMQASMGGMLESGLGRHLLAALAPLPAFTLIGDLSPAKRWLADDPFRDITMTKGEIMAPSRPGIAGEPMKNRLTRYTLRQAVVNADAALRSIR